MEKDCARAVVLHWREAQSKLRSVDSAWQCLCVISSPHTWGFHATYTKSQLHLAVMCQSLLLVQTLSWCFTKMPACTFDRPFKKAMRRSFSCAAPTDMRCVRQGKTLMAPALPEFQGKLLESGGCSCCCFWCNAADPHRRCGGRSGGCQQSALSTHLAAMVDEI